MKTKTTEFFISLERKKTAAAQRHRVTSPFTLMAMLALLWLCAASPRANALGGTCPGLFLPPLTFGGLGQPFSIALADFNKDGKLDLAIVDPLSGVRVVVSSVVVTSVLITNEPAHTVQYVTFEHLTSVYTVGDSPSAIVVNDFNGDTKADLVVADYESGNVSVLLGNGDGTFKPAANYLAGIGAYALAAGDFNGDGKADLAVAIYSSSEVAVLLNNGDDTFQAAINYSVAPGSGPLSVAVGDLNGDGKLDLVTANYDSSDVTVLLGIGSGTFGPASSHTAGSGCYSVTVGDFNGDTKADLAVANYDSSDVSVLLGNGNGTFQGAVNHGAGAGPVAVAVSDFNGDNHADLAVANYDSGNVSVLLGDGSGGFISVAASPFVVGISPSALAVGDVNQDGLPELGVASSQGVWVFVPDTSCTAQGLDVQVQLVDPLFQTSGTITFDNVTQPGTTTLQAISSVFAPDLGFTPSGTSVYFDLTTTATYIGDIHFCFNYGGLPGITGTLRMLHYENGGWQDVTDLAVSPNPNTLTTTICGVVSSLSPFALVSVQDAIPPVIANCPANVMVQTGPGRTTCDQTATWTPPTASDSSGVASLTSTHNSGASFPVGTTTVTYTATDGATPPNTTICSFTVTVVDNTPPTITGPVDLVIVSDRAACAAGDQDDRDWEHHARDGRHRDEGEDHSRCGENRGSDDNDAHGYTCKYWNRCRATGVVLTSPVVADNCGVASVVNNHPSTTYPLGVTLVTWTVTDTSGNLNTCVQKVTVVASVEVSFRSPLVRKPTNNTIRRGQVVPFKVELENCLEQTVRSGVTVKLQVQGIDAITGTVFQDVIEDANGLGTDGTITSDGLMQYRNSQWQFNLDTTNFGDPNTVAGSRYYRTTVTVIDNATLAVLGMGTVNLETGKK